MRLGGGRSLKGLPRAQNPVQLSDDAGWPGPAGGVGRRRGGTAPIPRHPKEREAQDSVGTRALARPIKNALHPVTCRRCPLREGIHFASGRSVGVGEPVRERWIN